MSTTNLFVELVVIGIGVFAWLALLLMSIFGVQFVSPLIDPGTVFYVPLLALIYVLGIVWDRVSDGLFEHIAYAKIEKNYFENHGEYLAARRKILTESEALAKLFDYSRSRSRICRGWFGNAVLLGITWNMLIYLNNPFPKLSPIILHGIGAISSITLACGLLYAWYSLTNREYLKVAGQYAYLSDQENDC